MNSHKFTVRRTQDSKEETRERGNTEQYTVVGEPGVYKHRATNSKAPQVFDTHAFGRDWALSNIIDEWHVYCSGSRAHQGLPRMDEGVFVYHCLDRGMLQRIVPERYSSSANIPLDPDQTFPVSILVFVALKECIWYRRFGTNIPTDWWLRGLLMSV